MQEYFILLYFEGIAQNVSQIGGLWPHCIEQVYRSHFSNSICSLHVLCLVAQLCPTLCDPMDYSPPGSSVHGILQAKVLEWVATLSSRDLPNPGIKPQFPTLQVDSLLFEPPEKPWRSHRDITTSCYILVILAIFHTFPSWLYLLMGRSLITDVTTTTHWRLR